MILGPRLTALHHTNKRVLSVCNDSLRRDSPTQQTYFYGQQRSRVLTDQTGIQQVPRLASATPRSNLPDVTGTSADVEERAAGPHTPPSSPQSLTGEVKVWQLLTETKIRLLPCDGGAQVFNRAGHADD